MKTTYLIWKNPSCNGVNPDWQEITGQEFYALVNSPEAKSRYFIKHDSADADSNDGVIYMESTKTEYDKWRIEKNHSDYIRRQQHESGYQVISYHAMESEDNYSGEELIEDTGTNIEADYFKSVDKELLREMLSQLSEDEYRLLEYFYMSDGKRTLHGYSALTKTPFTTIQSRKIALLKKIKNFLQG